MNELAPPRKRDSGTYQLDFRYVDHEGIHKRKSVYGKTEQEVWSKRKQFLDHLENSKINTLNRLDQSIRWYEQFHESQTLITLRAVRELIDNEVDLEHLPSTRIMVESVVSTYATGE